MGPSTPTPALTDDVGFLLARASGNFVRASNAALLAHGLRVRSYSVLLLACAAEDGISQRDVAAVLGLDPSQVVLLVDELAESGLVERHPSGTDRRTKMVVATAAGQEVRAAAVGDVAGAVTALLADLTATERFLLRDLLSRLALGTAASLPPA
jgi:DNA-binding MarR family transcriptional regulator